MNNIFMRGAYENKDCFKLKFEDGVIVFLSDGDMIKIYETDGWNMDLLGNMKNSVDVERDCQNWMNSRQLMDVKYIIYKSNY